MLDIRWIRDNPAAFDAALKSRGLPPASADIVAVDHELRACQTELQDMQARRNQVSKEIGAAKAGGGDAQALIDEVADLKTAIHDGEETQRVLDAKLRDQLSGLPNVADSDAPVGADESANVEIRKVGEPRTFDFEPRDHVDLGEALGLMDFEAASRMSGARFVVLQGALARLERALGAFMLDIHTNDFGYTEISPPLLVHDAAMYGTAQLPKFAEDLYQTRPPEDWNSEPGIDQNQQGNQDMIGSRRWLIPTAETSLTNLVREQILDEAKLPIRLTAQTPCFRSEAGAAGKDTRGMIRQHQFTKVELVSVTTPEQATDEHERMTLCAEEILKRLELPYRVVVLSTGDMGFAAHKTYDIEVWLPGQNAYRERSSCSNCGDFQARRMNARYRPHEGKGTRLVHTLNGSGLAVGRALVGVLENYQRSDGAIVLPDALRLYMNGDTVIGPHG